MQPLANPFQEIAERLYRIESTLERFEKNIPPVPSKSQKEAFIDIEAAAKIAEKSKPTMYRLSRFGKIPCRKQGNKLYFLESEIRTWIESGRKVTDDDLRAEALKSLSK